MNDYIKNILEKIQVFHQHQAEMSVEEKYKLLFKLQVMHIEFKKMRREELSKIEKPWKETP